MKVGDLVRAKWNHRYFLVTYVWEGMGVSLCGFPKNQIFNFTRIERVS